MRNQLLQSTQQLQLDQLHSSLKSSAIQSRLNLLQLKVTSLHAYQTQLLIATEIASGAMECPWSQIQTSVPQLLSQMMLNKSCLASMPREKPSVHHHASGEEEINQLPIFHKVILPTPTKIWPDQCSPRTSAIQLQSKIGMPIKLSA